MANREQLTILRQGIKAWNKWRELNPHTKVDLSQIDLREENLAEANFKDADLSQTYLMTANLWNACFSGANLSKANLREADLTIVDFNKADLSGVDLSLTNLDNANFEDANLYSANLIRANLARVNFRNSKWENVQLGDTVFAINDMSDVFGLEKAEHLAPSSIGIDTIQMSKGNIPNIFLRGCGLSDWEIESAKLYNPRLSNDEIDEILYKIHDLRASQALQISPLFISYSHTNTNFVDKIEAHLNATGIRFWRDVHDMKSGRLETQIDRAIRQNPTVLLVLSENSLSSDWVEHEVHLARELEKEMSRDVLCPIALDDSWKKSNWPKRIMEQIMEYNILDFSDWQNNEIFADTFSKLIDGLELFYKR